MELTTRLQLKMDCSLCHVKTLLCALLLAGSATAEAKSRPRSGLRSHNFGPGPAALPEVVLERAAAEFLDFEGTGIGVMEWTNIDGASGLHPGVAAPNHHLQQMMLNTEVKLREALDIPEDYRVLFMHGGAVGQFAAVPLNLLGAPGSKGDYLKQGFWTGRAFKEASKFGDIKYVDEYTGATGPQWEQWQAACRDDATYFHICLSETVQGVEMLQDPPADWSGPPVVVDATSTLLSRPINVSSYGLIYSSGGKNIPAGVAVVIVRQSLLKTTSKQEATPAIFDYRNSAGALEPVSSIFESRPNTPPTFAVYMLGLVLDYLAEQGGVEAMDAKAEVRSSSVYDVAAASNGFYVNKYHRDARSRMNAVFALPSRELEIEFLSEAEHSHGLYFLFGHPSTGGGIRITMYNWVTDDAIEAVVSFMKDFSARHNRNEL